MAAFLLLCSLFFLFSLTIALPQEQHQSLSLEHALKDGGPFVPRGQLTIAQHNPSAADTATRSQQQQPQLSQLDLSTAEVQAIKVC